MMQKAPGDTLGETLLSVTSQRPSVFKENLTQHMGFSLGTPKDYTNIQS